MPSEPRLRRRWLQPAEAVRELRRRLGLTQAAFAARLGVSVRTVLRGEQRGLEIPWRSDSRAGVYDAWAAMQREGLAAIAEASEASLNVTSADPALSVTSRAIARKVSRPKRPRKKRLRTSRELLRARGGKNGGRR